MQLTYHPQSETKGAQSLVVLLVEFPDKQHRISSDRVRDIVFNELDVFIKENSYGLAWITGDLIDKWYQVKTTLSKLDIEKWSYKAEDMTKFEREAIKAADNDMNFRNYAYVIIVSAGGVWPHAECEFEVHSADTPRPLRGFVVNEDSGMGTYAHELLHLLPSNYNPSGGCGLPDLYSYETSKKDEYTSPWVGPWDIMDESRPAKHLSAWSKMTLGWLTPDLVAVKSGEVSVVNLQPLETGSGSRVIFIPVKSTISYVIEVRHHIGYDSALPDEGVLIYLVDPTKKSGYGPVRVVDRATSTETLDDAPFKQGNIFEDYENNVHVGVAFTDGSGFTVMITASDFHSLDTDKDGLDDYDEMVQYRTDPTNRDTDGDGLFDGDEITRVMTSPLKADTDDDGISDMKETQLGTDPNNADTDSDGLKDGKEIQVGTEPLKADTDGDQLNDGDEVNKYGTNPLNPDTDGDGVPDGREVQIGASPVNADTDGDYWRDNIDFAPTNPLMPNVSIAAVVAALTLVIVFGKRKRSPTTPAHEVSGTNLPTAAATGRSATLDQFCINCGSPLPAGSRFCHKCSARHE